MNDVTIEGLIGLAVAPLLIIALTSHVKGFARTLASALGYGMTTHTGATPWPLVADTIGVAWALALWHADVLPEDVGVTSAVLVGLALGVAAAKVRDVGTAVLGGKVEG